MNQTNQLYYDNNDQNGPNREQLNRQKKTKSFIFFSIRIGITFDDDDDYNDGQLKIRSDGRSVGWSVNSIVVITMLFFLISSFSKLATLSLDWKLQKKERFQSSSSSQNHSRIKNPNDDDDDSKEIDSFKFLYPKWNDPIEKIENVFFLIHSE